MISTESDVKLFLKNCPRQNGNLSNVQIKSCQNLPLLKHAKSLLPNLLIAKYEKCHFLKIHSARPLCNFGSMVSNPVSNQHFLVSNS